MNEIRKFENFHIILWLLKDTSWLMNWQALGISMILPTVSLAIFMTWRFRKTMSELYHNLAVVCWICANSFWMLTEFFGAENLQIFAAIPFALGFICLFTYYAKLLRRKLSQ